MKCPVCGSEGFGLSITGLGCTFCDGTEGGNPPDTYICGQTKPLSPEALDELNEMGEYLRAGGKRVYGSFDNWRKRK